MGTNLLLKPSPIPPSSQTSATHPHQAPLTLNDGAVFGGRKDGQVVGGDDQTRDGELVASQDSQVTWGWGLDLGGQRDPTCSHTLPASRPEAPTQGCKGTKP